MDVGKFDQSKLKTYGPLPEIRLEIRLEILIAGRFGCYRRD